MTIYNFIVTGSHVVCAQANSEEEAENKVLDYYYTKGDLHDFTIFPDNPEIEADYEIRRVDGIKHADGSQEFTTERIENQNRKSCNPKAE